MGDVYVEQLVKRQTPQKYRIYTALLAAATVLLAFCGLVLVPRLLPYLLIASVFLAVLTYYLTRNWDVEYEYIYVNGELDIDKIMAKSKRKRVLSVDMANLEVMAPANSHGLDSFKNMNCEDYDCSSQSQESDRTVYVMVVRQDGGATVRLRFEPNEKIVSSIRQISPRKVMQV